MKEKISILIADDNVEFANTMAECLNKHEDMEVVGLAKDGNEAVEMVKIMKPDVALLDVIMPHLDGLGVLEKIQELDIENKPICIMISAVGQDKITQKAITLGAEYYVVKPFDIEDTAYHDVIKLYADVRQLQINNDLNNVSDGTGKKIIRKKAGDDWF